ncbi:MAG TPA: hypothetical protein VES79_01405 [Solirubrobacteraceae bacterium]|nr:hypothetical protein [Solirubrobacteraceae bacterium]
MTRLPELAVDLLDHLPAIEPDREVTDWGRSERVEGLLDRTIYDFLYQREVEDFLRYSPSLERADTAARLQR